MSLASTSRGRFRPFLDAPPEFICPLLRTVMATPVTSETTGISFERSAIMTWMSLWGNTCPVNGGPLGQLKPNTVLMEKISAWQQKRRLDLQETLAAPSPDVSSTHKSTREEKKNISNPTSSFISASNNRKLESKKVDPKQFEKVLGFVQSFTDYLAKNDIERFEGRDTAASRNECCSHAQLQQLHSEH